MSYEENPSTDRPGGVRPGAVLVMPAQRQEKNLSSADQKFMMKAARINLAEIECAQLALKHGTGTQLKAFAERMLKDHRRLNDQLKEVAAKHNVTLPTTLNAQQRQEAEQLSRLKGTAFDNAFANDMVTNHARATAKFKQEAKNVQDPRLRRWTDQAIPVLDEHLRLARKLERTEK